MICDFAVKSVYSCKRVGFFSCNISRVCLCFSGVLFGVFLLRPRSPSGIEHGNARGQVVEMLGDNQCESSSSLGFFHRRDAHMFQLFSFFCLLETVHALPFQACDLREPRIKLWSADMSS